MQADQVVKLLRKRVEGKTQVQVAREIGVSTAYLSDVLLGKRTPGPKILVALGLRADLVYRQK